MEDPKLYDVTFPPDKPRAIRKAQNRSRRPCLCPVCRTVFLCDMNEEWLSCPLCSTHANASEIGITHLRFKLIRAYRLWRGRHRKVVSLTNDA